MGVTGRLRAFAFARPRYLPVAVPGRPWIRLAVERAAYSRGWRVAESPADADVLVICGDAPEALASAVDHVWWQIMEPRARVTVMYPAGAGRVLDGAATVLAAAEDSMGAGSAPGGRAGDEWSGHAGGDRAGTGEPGAPHDDRHGAADEQGHGEQADGGPGGHMGHMGQVAGLSMADRADDRDGLRLDVLHVPFGPVLPDWPAGLVLDMTVQGDVVAHAEAHQVPLGEPVDTPPSGAIAPAVAGLDGLARLLAVAGHDGPARRCRTIRDSLTTADDVPEARHRFVRLARRLGRSATLRWMLRDVGPIDAAIAERLGLGAAASGDAYDRFLRRLANVEATLTGSPASADRPTGASGDASASFVAALPSLVEGAELAAVRLIVAGLDPGVGWVPARVVAGG